MQNIHSFSSVYRYFDIYVFLALSLRLFILDVQEHFQIFTVGFVLEKVALGRFPSEMSGLRFSHASHHYYSVTVCHNISSFIKIPTEAAMHTNILNQILSYEGNIFLVIKYIPHLLLKSEFHFQARPDPAHKLLANLYDIYHCCMYSEKLLMMDRGTVRNT